jgi:recombinational DNA repair protein RecR
LKEGVVGMRMDKVFYEIDPFNRLIIGSPPGARKSGVKKFRQVVYGRFRTDENNALFYEVNKSSGIDTPQKIKFSGKYSLDKDHDFIITLNKWNNQCEGNRLTLKTKIIDANNNEIALSVNSKAGENKSLTYVMKLYGSWQADKNNRLTFGVERDQGGVDALTLSGAWEINKNNEIIYRRGRDSQIITFRGYWDIADRCRLNYILDKKTNSGFNFRSSIGTLAPKDKETYATFDVGIAMRGVKKLRRRIIFSGRLKMSKGKELILETPDAEEGGASLRFTKEMFDKQGIAYIESIFRDKERFIGGGVTFRW